MLRLRLNLTTLWALLQPINQGGQTPSLAMTARNSNTGREWGSALPWLGVGGAQHWDPGDQADARPDLGRPGPCLPAPEGEPRSGMQAHPLCCPLIVLAQGRPPRPKDALDQIAHWQCWIWLWRELPATQGALGQPRPRSGVGRRWVEACGWGVCDRAEKEQRQGRVAGWHDRPLCPASPSALLLLSLLVAGAKPECPPPPFPCLFIFLLKM